MNIETTLIGSPNNHTTTVHTRNGPKTVIRKSRVPTLAKAIARFLSGRTARSKDECWNWVRSTNDKGYGQVRCAAGNVKAHRIAYMIEHGSIPDGVSVLHKCDNPKCVNPHHLFLGTQRDNMDDMHAKGRHIKGEKHKLSKLSESDARTIYESSSPSSKLASQFNVCVQLVNAIKRGAKWKHLHADALSVKSPLETFST